MKNNRTIRLFAVWILLLFCAAALSACGTGGAGAETIVPFVPEEDSGDLYFCGVVQSGGAYYVRVLQDYLDEPSAGDYLYIPLADEISACFQENGTVGAWSPIEYYTAEELAQADADQQITPQIRFSYGITDGRMDFLEEHDPYTGFDVTTGEV